MSIPASAFRVGSKTLIVLFRAILFLEERAVAVASFVLILGPFRRHPFAHMSLISIYDL